MTSRRSELTQSALSTFRECPRKYQFAYEMQRVRRREGTALVLGKALHGSLEAWWKGNGSLEAAVEWLQQNAVGLEEPDACRITAMIQHYRPPVNLQPITGPRVTADPLSFDFEQVARDAEIETQQSWPEYEVIGTEVPFTVEIENPRTGRKSQRFLLSGKVDGLLRRRDDGSVWVLEHKSTSDEIRGFGPYWQRLQVDSQVAFYVLAHGAAGVLYDVLRKPVLKPRGNETMDQFTWRCQEAIAEDRERYYQFREVRKTAADIRDAAEDLWQQAQMLGHSRRFGFFPRNSNSCRSLWGNCPFLDVCTGAARIDDEDLFRSKVAIHEELQDEVAA